MANPRRPGETGTGAGGIALPDPVDPNEIIQKRLLEEAVLVSFSASPNPLSPFGRTTLKWDITMPTTVVPGVQVEVHLYDGFGDHMVDSKGIRTVAPLGDTTCVLSLRVPLAIRQLGTLPLSINLGTCIPFDTPPIVIMAVVKSEAEKAFPPGGEVTLRGDGARVDIGINSLVIDIPLEAEVPHWFNTDIDISLGYSLTLENGDVRVTYDFSKTTVSIGALTGLLTSGISEGLALALEKVSDAYLKGLVGAVIAERISAALTTEINASLDKLDAKSVPVTYQPRIRSHNYRLHDITLTEVGMTSRYCPVTTAVMPTSTNPPLGGGNAPVHL